MCRRKNKCTELDDNPENWDKQCLLRPPEWVDDGIILFSQAINEFIRGEKEKCLSTLLKINDNGIRVWFSEHGQMSGRHRRISLDLPKPKKIELEFRDPLRSPKRYQKFVFERDNYHCRYCGNKLISQELLRCFSKKINSPIFKKGPTNSDTHGIIHAAWPVADHVIPWNLGGETNLDNLVSSCGACNYGKDGYTCEQLGIENPFNRPPIHSDWDGLVSKEIYIRKTV